MAPEVGLEGILVHIVIPVTLNARVANQKALHVNVVGHVQQPHGQRGDIMAAGQIDN